jgi:CheY-like chemotaxis protein
MKHRILVVDDHPDAADASCMLLEMLGHDTQAATTGKTALATAETFHPDIVLLDIGLPDLSGYEVARALRSRHGREIYLVAITGWAQPEDRVKSIAAGIDQHIQKPANSDKIRAVIRDAEAQGAARVLT